MSVKVIVGSRDCRPLMGGSSRRSSHHYRPGFIDYVSWPTGSKLTITILWLHISVLRVIGRHNKHRAAITIGLDWRNP